MMNSKYIGYVADAVLILHVIIAVFMVLGLIFIVTGGVRKWSWIRNFWFRLIHLLSIVLVAVESWFGVICPLTEWEMRLREISGQDTFRGDFIAHWLQRILYYDAPPWVFIFCYTLFGLLVIGCWIFIRPKRH